MTRLFEDMIRDYCLIFWFGSNLWYCAKLSPSTAHSASYFFFTYTIYVVTDPYTLVFSVLNTHEDVVSHQDPCIPAFMASITVLSGPSRACGYPYFVSNEEICLKPG